MVKSLKLRLDECTNIRKQLQGFGLLAIDEFSTKVAKAMNCFVKNNIGQVIQHSFDSKIRIQITLSTEKASGISICE